MLNENEFIASPDMFPAKMNQGENLSYSQELMPVADNQLKKGQRKWFWEDF